MKIRHNINRKLSVVVTVGVAVVFCLLYVLFVYDRNTKVTTTQELVPQEQKQDEVIAVEPIETTPPVVEQPKSTPQVVAPPPTWPVLLTNSEASSLTVVVNKKHKLSSDYVPELTTVTGGQLRSEAAQALTKLLSKADEAGVSMSTLSSYRSYSTQVSTYNKWVNQSGQSAADTFSARPGHSEHQLGIAVDLGNGTCNLETCFGDTIAGLWLASNAQKYGFIIRYPLGKDSVTGYQYEPWHLRYVGVDAATAITASGQTMDEYYGIAAGNY